MKKERKININKMFWYVIKKWRLILLGAIVCAIIFGIFQYKKDYQNAILQRESQKEISVVEVRNSLTDEEMQMVEWAHLYEKMYNSIGEYINDSDYMRIDSVDVKKGTLLYEINVEEGQQIDVDSIYAAYENFVSGGELARIVEEELDEKKGAQYIEELISIPTEIENKVEIYEADNLYRTFSIQIIHYDSEKLQQLMENVENAMKKYSSELQNQFGNYNIRLLTENVGIKTDTAILTWQREIFKYRDEVATEYQKKMDVLNSNQMLVLRNWEELASGLLDDTGETEELIDDTKIQVGLNIKVMILGALGGIFAVIALVMVAFIGSNKLRGKEDLETLDTEVLGEIFSAKNQKSKNPIDNLIVKLQYFEQARSGREQAINQMTSNILLACQNREIAKVHLIGTNLTNNVNEEWIEEVQNKLAQKGIELYIEKDIISNTEAREKLLEWKDLIILEQENTSLFNIVEEELKICKQNGLNVLGAILVHA